MSTLTFSLGEYTEKKVSDFPVHSRDVTNQTLPGGERESLTFFYSVGTSNIDIYQIL